MLAAMQICTADRIVFSSVERQPFAYIVYDLNYQQNIAVVRDYCTAIGIPLLGRFAQFEYLNMDGVIRSVFDFVGRDQNVLKCFTALRLSPEKPTFLQEFLPE